MENNQQQVQIQVDPNMYFLTMANIMAEEEQFTFMMAYGNQARRYVLSPKHAKRFMLLLNKQMGEYEAKHGVVAAELPVVGDVDTSAKAVGFQPEQD